MPGPCTDGLRGSSSKMPLLLVASLECGYVLNNRFGGGGGRRVANISLLSAKCLRLQKLQGSLSPITYLNNQKYTSQEMDSQMEQDKNLAPPVLVRLCQRCALWNDNAQPKLVMKAITYTTLSLHQPPALMWRLSHGLLLQQDCLTNPTHDFQQHKRPWHQTAHPWAYLTPHSLIHYEC